MLDQDLSNRSVTVLCDTMTPDQILAVVNDTCDHKAILNGDVCHTYNGGPSVQVITFFKVSGKDWARIKQQLKTRKSARPIRSALYAFSG